MVLWHFAIFAFLIVVVYLLLKFRPGVSKFKSGINWLYEYGKDGSEVSFVNQISEKEILFRLTVIGGVKQICIVIDKLKLNPEQRTCLINLLAERGLKLQTSTRKFRNEFINVGHSRKTAELVSIQIAKEIMHWTKLTRFVFSFKDFDLHRVR
jgi:hypothetical protein